MFIEAIKIRIIAKSGKKYGRYINFLNNDKINELNLIYGKNALGKSTLIESIIYALNGEAIYGKRKKDIINYKMILSTYLKDTLEHAEIYLQLSNKKERIVVLRDAIDSEEPVIVFKNVKLEKNDDGKSLNNKTKEKEFYKINKERDITGNKTYQEFLFSFLGIEPIRKKTDNDEDNSERLIFYIQNLMPLFIIHQGAWHDIQAINPRYDINEIKKTAFEVIMNFTSTDVIKYRYLLESYQTSLRQKNNSIKDIQEVIGLLSFSQVSEIDNEIERKTKELQDLSNKISEMEKGTTEINHVIKEIRSKYRHKSLVARRYLDSLETLESEIDQYNYYINKIQSDIEKNDKLKTAKKLIGILPIEFCPRCLNKVSIKENEELEKGYCSLCGNEFQTPHDYEKDNTLNYLKDELKDFQRLKLDKEEEKRQISNKLFLVQLELKELKETMDNYEAELRPQNLEQYNFYSREIGRLKNIITELQKDKEIIKKYEKLLNEKEKLAEEVKNLRKKIKDIKSHQDLDNKKLEFFEKQFKDILFDLDFLKDGFDESKVEEGNSKKSTSDIIKEIYNQIKIDREDYYPKIEGINLYNITSSSGLIRIILSYYIALLKTALEFKDSVNHPMLLIMDEPRQQNLDLDTFNKFLDIFSKLKKEYPETQFQVIIASSEKGNCQESNISLDLGDNSYLIQEIDN